jgi:glutamate formiminotransferase/formiminotetrahydrofolate cyclodeaminase
MGVDLKSRGLAQVSMNLTDYEQTSIGKVFEAVSGEAERYGIGIKGSEVVGLVPQAALDAASEKFLKMENFRPEMIFENRLQALPAGRQTLPDLSVSAFMGAVAGTGPVPGGGSVAALAGALSAALGEMVSGFSLSKKELKEYRGRLQQLAERFKDVHLFLRVAIQKDSDSYAGVESAMKMPKTSDQEKLLRQECMQQALKTAALVPMEVAEKAAGLLHCFLELEPISNPNLKSDFQTGFWMAHAAIRGALANVAINLQSIRDEAFCGQLRERVRAIEEIAAASASVSG